jgi:chemotaxis protein MotB
MARFALINTGLTAGALATALVLGGCGVDQSKYDAVVQQNQQLQQQVATQQQQISRLEGAIVYTVNSDLLFPSGGYQMSDQGKEIINRLSSKLAPAHDKKIYVYGFTDNQPVGPALQREGIANNDVLSQKRAENVTQFLESQGWNSSLLEARGLGESMPATPNNTPAGRAQNRRVELTLAPITG